MNILSSEQLHTVLLHSQVLVPHETLTIGFFVANCDAWKYRYEDAKKIFQTACQGEIDLWNYAEDQKGAVGTTSNGET